MSKLPNINSSRSSLQNTDNESMNNIIESQNEEKNIVLPLLNQDNSNNNNYDMTKNPLLLNSKLIELEAKYITLEQNYEHVLNKINTNEKKIFSLQNNMIKTDNIINNNNVSNTNKKISESDEHNRHIIILNNKIKYLEEMLKSDQEIRLKEKQKELDFTKDLFNKINSSLTNTIQMEVEQRFKADLLQKNSNMKEIDILQNQLNAVKLQLEQIQSNFLKKLEEYNNECSERNQNLAKYIDVRLDEQNLKKDSRELKKFVEKLTEQIKNNMTNQKLENELCNKKILNSEKKLDNSIKEIYDFLGKIESRTINKIKNLKKYFEINLLTNNNLTEKNINRIIKQFEKNFIFFSEELLSSRNYINLEFQNMNKKIKFNLQTVISDLENIIKNQVQLENIVKKRFEEIEQMKKDIFKETSNLESKVNIDIKNEKILREVEHNLIKTELKTVSSSMNNTTDAVFNSLNKLLTENDKNNEFNKKKFIELDKNILIHRKSIIELKANVYDAVAKILMNEMTQKAIEENMYQEISKVKLFEKSIINNRNEIIKLNDRIVDAFKSLGGISQQGTKINDMLIEKEIRDDVDKMMARMVEECILAEIKEENAKKISNLEEKFDKQWTKQEKKNDDLSSNLQEIDKKGEIMVKDLENKIYSDLKRSNIDKSVTQMITNTDIDNIYELISGIKPVKVGASNIDDKNLDKVFKLIEDNNEVTKKALASYSDIIENKTNKIMEKIKEDNINMWENSISLGQKINTPEEIKNLIQEVHPVIYPLDDTLQKIMDLDFKHPESKPFIPDLFENEKIIDEQNYGKIVINQKENGKKEEDVKLNENNNINNNKENNEKNSNGSINSKNSKSSDAKKKEKII